MTERGPENVITGFFVMMAIIAVAISAQHCNDAFQKRCVERPETCVTCPCALEKGP